MNKHSSNTFFSSWPQDFAASVVVFLVALPLCLGIALASLEPGASLMPGLIAGIVGGIVVTSVSGAALSVSGPAAGLVAIVIGALASLGSFEAFLTALVLAGIFQIVLGAIGAGVIADFVPSAVIKGMLASIGIILILKQIPHAVGWDKDYTGDTTFWQADGENTFSEIFHLLDHQLSLGAALIALISLFFLVFWESLQKKGPEFLKLVPGPLIVVCFGVFANFAYGQWMPSLAISAEHLVPVPAVGSFSGLIAELSSPDFSVIFKSEVWTAAITLALVASIETLLCIEAVDKLDPLKRISPTNRELVAQGVGNMASGFCGGLPITSVIVRSSANVNAGAKNRFSAFSHGVMLLLSVIFAAPLLRLIPLSALAAVLLFIGYKLTRPVLFKEEWRKGSSHFVPFVVTIGAILLTDLLIGVLIGLAVGAFFVIRSNFRKTVVVEYEPEHQRFHIDVLKDLSFVHKSELKRALAQVPDGADLHIDLSHIEVVDLDNIEILEDFLRSAPLHDRRVSIRQSPHQKIVAEGLDSLHREMAEAPVSNRKAVTEPILAGTVPT